ncbi:MAG TPA: hypothetical protein VL418_10205 [Devosiaceae bacterium]|nr:hypothetical protein [Devosiaceae bacterium]
MSDMLTHWAVFDDSLRLMQRDQRIEPAFVEACRRQPQIARLGACTRAGSKWMQPLIELARASWNTPEAHPVIDRRLAWAVGGITHQACDTVAKPLLSVHAGAEWNLAHEVLQQTPKGRGHEDEVDTRRVQQCSAYYDVHVFKKVYVNGSEEPFARFFLSNELGPVGKVFEEFVGTMFQRALLSAHTFKPPQPYDDNSFLAWQDHVFDYMQPRYLDTQIWIDAFTTPDPALIEEFGVETNFYRDDDPMIEVARAIHAGGSVSQSAIEAASRDGLNQSMYGQALELSLRYLVNGTDFWHGRKDRLEAPLAYEPQWYRETLHGRQQGAGK